MIFLWPSQNIWTLKFNKVEFKNRNEQRLGVLGEGHVLFPDIWTLKTSQTSKVWLWRLSGYDRAKYLMKYKGKSTQYKKLDPNALRFTYYNLKYSKSHEKNKTKDIRPLVFSFSSIELAFWCFLFCFFMWFARFQILISEPIDFTR